MSQQEEQAPLSVTLGNAGGDIPLVCGSRIYKVGHPDQVAKKILEQIVKSVPMNEVRDMKLTMTPAAYEETFAKALKNLKSYKTWGDGWVSVLNDPDNAYFFLWSLLFKNHPDLTGEQVAVLYKEYPEEVALVYSQVLPPFFQLLTDAAVEKVPKEHQEQFRKMTQPLLERFVPILQTKPSTT